MQCCQDRLGELRWKLEMPDPILHVTEPHEARWQFTDMLRSFHGSIKLQAGLAIGQQVGLDNGVGKLAAGQAKWES